MELSIITDDTSVKLPIFNKWKLKYSVGIDIRMDSKIKQLLSEYNINYPTNDIENELLFKKLLRDFVRPAIQMYGGMFTEVRHFAPKISPLIPTKIYFVSGRYGLIPENQEIIPYYYQIETLNDVEVVDKKFNIKEKIQNLIEKSDVIIFFLPKHYIAYLIKNDFFKEFLFNSYLIIVSSDEYRDYFLQFQNVLFLNRIGVARIGKKNREIILKFLEQHVRIKKGYSFVSHKKK